MGLQNISHSGIIKEKTDSYVIVSIFSESACSACHAKESCGVSEIKEKLVRVKTNKKNYTIGQNVEVTMKENMGFYAVLLAYLLPFFVLLVSLITFVFLVEETIAALLSFSVVGIYYYVLFLNRNKINKTIVFEIE